MSAFTVDGFATAMAIGVMSANLRLCLLMRSPSLRLLKLSHKQCAAFICESLMLLRCMGERRGRAESERALLLCFPCERGFLRHQVKNWQEAARSDTIMNDDEDYIGVLTYQHAKREAEKARVSATAELPTHRSARNTRETSLLQQGTF
jgi:hypothetical protein